LGPKRDPVHNVARSGGGGKGLLGVARHINVPSLRTLTKKNGHEITRKHLDKPMKHGGERTFGQAERQKNKKEGGKDRYKHASIRLSMEPTKMGEINLVACTRAWGRGECPTLGKKAHNSDL